MAEGVQAIVRALPGPALLVSIDGEIVAASESAARLFALDDSSGPPGLARLSADPQPIPDYLAAALRSRTPLAGTMALRTSSNTITRFVCSASAVTLPDAPAMLLLQLRESDREQPMPRSGGNGGSRALAELRESEERFRATFEQAAVGMAHVALDGVWLRVNQRLCEIVGFAKHEL
jgi:PAS domain-containing protein